MERVWVQHIPMGDFAMVYWEIKDIGKVFETLMKSHAHFDKWFREKVLAEVHSMDFSKPMAMNELMLDSKV